MPVLDWCVFSGRVGIVDHDVVELNNLHRQVNGKHKTTLLVLMLLYNLVSILSPDILKLENRK